jgi:exonuclease SbcC
LQQRIGDIETKLKDLSNVKNDYVVQNERRSRIHLLALQLKENKKSSIELDKNIRDLKFDAKRLEACEKKCAEYKKDLETKQGEKDKKLQEIGTLKNELKRIVTLEKRNKEREKELVIKQEDAKDYQTLSQAFGKNGVQALLIEQVIPQIEEEANNILARLTDNQAQVFIESLRDLKSGGVKETLDIQISDTAGIRPYEMFSGGEAFRVDFALRIAISKLLARRAGTALQTLIIDEGFGSQDEEGLSRLMDAIYAIKKDFSKVIVVSHLTSFKENFPVHFLVDKNAQGSFLRVEQRG